MSDENEEGCFTLTWEIKNLDLVLTTQLETRILHSPPWMTETSDGSKKWGMVAYHYDFYIHFQLRTFERGGLVRYGVDFNRWEFYLQSSQGNIPLEFDGDRAFSIDQKVIFADNEQSIIYNDTVTVCFKMWMATMKTGETRVHSVLHKLNYLWNIENFDSSIFYSNTFIEKESVLFYLFLDRKTGDDEYKYHPLIFGGSHIAGCIFTLVDCKLSKDGCRCIDVNEIHSPLQTTWKLDLEIPPQNNEAKFLQLNVDSIYAIHKISEEIPASSRTLSDDLLCLYKEEIYSDATLNTEGKSFQAHRNILSARSAVFKAMFEKEDTVEGRSGVVDIDDVDSDTVDRMLAFLYGDSLEDLMWEKASELYYAADKYAVHPLKRRCRDTLKAGLSLSNACDALVLADKHSDDELMKCTADFIRSNEEVVSSLEWEQLEEDNPRLIVKIMRQVYVKKEKK